MTTTEQQCENTGISHEKVLFYAKKPQNSLDRGTDILVIILTYLSGQRNE